MQVSVSESIKTTLYFHQILTDFQNSFAVRLSSKNTCPFNGRLSGTIQVSRYQKGKTNLDFGEATDSEWQWHQLGYMQVCTSLQTDNHASTPPLSFLQAGCPSCHSRRSIKFATWSYLNIPPHLKHVATLKGKGSPYSITERRVSELILVLGSQPAGDVS